MGRLIGIWYREFFWNRNLVSEISAVFLKSEFDKEGYIYVTPKLTMIEFLFHTKLGDLCAVSEVDDSSYMFQVVTAGSGIIVGSAKMDVIVISKWHNFSRNTVQIACKNYKNN